MLEILSLMEKEEEEFSYKKISIWWLCMVDFWMSAYDCCRASSTTIRYVEAVRKISHRESEFHKSHEQLQQKPQNHDMRFHNLIAVVKRKHEIWTVDFLHWSFGDRDFNMQRTQCNKNPDFRDM
jgi:hypothetical protein